MGVGGGWPFGLGGGGPASRTGFGGGKLSLGHPPRGPETAVGNTVRGSVPGHSDDLEIGVQIGCKLTSPCSQNFKHC